VIFALKENGACRVFLCPPPSHGTNPQDGHGHSSFTFSLPFVSFFCPRSHLDAPRWLLLYPTVFSEGSLNLARDVLLKIFHLYLGPELESDMLFYLDSNWDNL
jgi:hypothetical protein